jgi:16S rRNA C1402 (ribose-2'-O) methylase RsmI
MGRVSEDTHPRLQAVMAQMLAALTPARRMAMVRDLTRTTIGWSRRAVRAAMPEADAREALLQWVAVTYGQEIAVRLRGEERQLGT